MTGDKKVSVWQLPKFYFRVKFETWREIISFQEVSGLDNEAKYLNSINGVSKSISTFKLPENSKAANLTFKRGVFFRCKGILQLI